MPQVLARRCAVLCLPPPLHKAMPPHHAVPPRAPASPPPPTWHRAAQHAQQAAQPARAEIEVQHGDRGLEAQQREARVGEAGRLQGDVQAAPLQQGDLVASTL